MIPTGSKEKWTLEHRLRGNRELAEQMGKKEQLDQRLQHSQWGGSRDREGEGVQAHVEYVYQILPRKHFTVAKYMCVAFWRNRSGLENQIWEL